MGRKSTRENKTIYQCSREDAEMTLERAGEAMFVSPDRIAKIEGGKSAPHPDEVLAMAQCYKNPALCNYYCSHECPIGQQYVPEVKVKALSQIVLELLASLNTLNRERDRLVEITVDGVITEDEYRDFAAIRDQLAKISLAVDAMQLWLEKTVAEGSIDPQVLDTAEQ